MNIRNLVISSVTSGGMNLVTALASYFAGQSSNTAPIISISPQISNLIVALLGKVIPQLATVPTSLVSMVVSFVIGWILLGLIIWAGLRTIGIWLVGGVCILLGAGFAFALLLLGVVKL